MMSVRRWRWATGVAGGVIAGVTLIPASVPEAMLARTPWWCLVCGDQGAVDVLLNVLLFIPFGLTLRGGGLGTRWVAVAGCLTAIFIEIAQGTLIPGRDASLSDVLTNTTGTLIGAGLILHWRQMIRPSPSVAGRASLMLAVVWIGQAVATCKLLVPAPSATDTYIVQWGQVFPGTVPFRGEIISASAAEIPLHPGFLASTDSLKRRMRTTPISMSVLVRGAPRVLTRAQIVAINDGQSTVVAWINQHECSIQFRIRLKSEEARLSYPAVTTEIPCDLAENRLRLDGQVTDRAISVLVTEVDSGQQWTTTLPISPNLGWSLLVPGIRSYHDFQWPSAVWAMLWVGALVYLASMSQNRSQVWMTGGAVLIVFLLLPLLFRLEPVSLVEWGGAVFAWFIGSRLAKAVGPTSAESKI